jgi:hypothetical protein
MGRSVMTKSTKVMTEKGSVDDAIQGPVTKTHWLADCQLESDFYFAFSFLAAYPSTLKMEEC